MSHEFPRKCKTGTVAGVDVVAYPVLWGRVRAIIEAEAASDSAGMLTGMADSVSESVRFSDGTALPVETLDVETISQLFAFASGGRGAQNPTSFASPATGAQAQTPPVPTT